MTENIQNINYNSDNSNNSISNNSNSSNPNIKIHKKRGKKPNEMICSKCNIAIDKIIGSCKICIKCHNEKSRNYYDKKIQPNRIYKMKYCYDKTYTDSNGKEIKLLITNDYKKCRLCEKEKIFNEYEFISSKEKDKKTLSADCKECLKKCKINRKLLINNLNSINNNNMIEINNNLNSINNNMIEINCKGESLASDTSGNNYFFVY